MKISYSKKFTKEYIKLSQQVKDKFIKRQAILSTHYFHPLLNNHQLHGEWAGCRSINITGDIRAIFEELENNHIEFIAIGGHSELYS